MTDRALSTSFSYVLTLGITTLLATVLIIAGGQFVSDQRERTVETDLQVIGEQLAADIEQVDRVVSANSSAVDTIGKNQSLPDAVAGERYRIEIMDGPNVALRLWTDSPSETAIIPVHNQTAIASDTINGGDVTITYDAASDEIEVKND